MLTARQRTDFEELGYCVVPAAVDRDLAREMAGSLLRFLDQEIGVRLDDPTTWRDLRGGAHFTGLVKTGVFRPVGSPRLKEALDDLLGPGAWTDRHGWGTPLVTLPGQPSAIWDVPTSGWHTDFPVSPAAPVLRMFAYLDDVRPQGAGTLVIAGSHRMAASWADQHPDTSRSSSTFKKSLRQSNPWFADLFSSGRSREIRKARFMDEPGEAYGVPVRVVELCAEAGDVVLWHPSLMHAEAPNALRDPRMMVTHTVERKGNFGRLPD